MTAPNRLRRLSGIADLPARVRAVEDWLERLGTEAFSGALDALARDATHGATSVGVDGAMLACGLWLAGPAAAPHLRALLEAARGGEHRVATAMLDVDDDAPRAHKQLSKHGRLPDHGGPSRVERHKSSWHPPESELRQILEEQHWLAHPWDDHHEHPAERLVFSPSPTLPGLLHDYDSAEALGVPHERSTWARVRLPHDARGIAAQVERLSMRSEPDVIRRLLGGRSVTVRDVVKVAARRPLTPAIVAEVVAHYAWMAYPSVRFALVENPFTPTRTALALLPSCRLRLRSVREANVHPRVRALVDLLAA